MVTYSVMKMITRVHQNISAGNCFEPHKLITFLEFYKSWWWSCWRGRISGSFRGSIGSCRRFVCWMGLCNKVRDCSFLFPLSAVQRYLISCLFVFWHDLNSYTFYTDRISRPMTLSHFCSYRPIFPNHSAALRFNVHRNGICENR